MKHLICLLLFVFCLFGQGCTNDDTIIEDCPSQKCGMTPEEVEVRVEEIRKKYRDIKNWYYEVKDYDSISNKDLDLLEEKIKKLSEWVDEDEVKDQ